MEYFLISNSTEKKETGVIGPQCMVFPDGYNLDWYELPNSMTNLTNDCFPDFEPSLIFELDKKAKLTDFISQAIILARGFLINQKVKEIFEQFNLGQHKFYPATVIHKENKYQYFWLHLLDNDYYDIDYKNSLFYEGNSAGWKNYNISINSYDELKNIKNQDIPNFIWVEKLRLNELFTINISDIIMFSNIHNKIFVSDQLYSSLKENRCTGFKVTDQNILNI